MGTVVTFYLLDRSTIEVNNKIIQFSRTSTARSGLYDVPDEDVPIFWAGNRDGDGEDGDDLEIFIRERRPTTEIGQRQLQVRIISSLLVLGFESSLSVLVSSRPAANLINILRL